MMIMSGKELGDFRMWQVVGLDIDIKFLVPHKFEISVFCMSQIINHPLFIFPSLFQTTFKNTWSQNFI